MLIFQWIPCTADYFGNSQQQARTSIRLAKPFAAPVNVAPNRRGRSTIAGRPPRSPRQRVNPTPSGLLQRALRNSNAARQVKAPKFADMYEEATWSTDSVDYCHQDTVFRGKSPGPSFEFSTLPNTYESLFRRFWSNLTLDKICYATNRYASEEVTAKGYPVAGPNWWPLQRDELKAFFGLSLLFGIKRLPNHRCY